MFFLPQRNSLFFTKALITPVLLNLFVLYNLCTLIEILLLWILEGNVSLKVFPINLAWIRDQQGWGLKTHQIREWENISEEGRWGEMVISSSCKSAKVWGRAGLVQAAGCQHASGWAGWEDKSALRKDWSTKPSQSVFAQEIPMSGRWTRCCQICTMIVWYQMR